MYTDHIDMVDESHAFEVFVAKRTDWNKWIVVLRTITSDGSQNVQMDMTLDYTKTLIKYLQLAVREIES